MRNVGCENALTNFPETAKASAHPISRLHLESMDQPDRPSKNAGEIRKAREGDKQSILKCLAEAFEPYREQYTAGAYADTVLNEAALGARMQTMHVLVALWNGEIIGTVAGSKSHPGEGHLRGMAVLPQHKGS